MILLFSKNTFLRLIDQRMKIFALQNVIQFQRNIENAGRVSKPVNIWHNNWNDKLDTTM